MQYLRKDYASYYHHSELSSIVLHGLVGEVECKLLITTTSVKIGSGWKKFCVLHDLSADNLEEIFFEVENERPSNNIKVLYDFIYNF